MEAGLTKSNTLFIDNTFVAQDSGVYQLLVHFDGIVLNYAVVDPGTNVVIVIGKDVKKVSQTNILFLRETLQNNDILKLEFKNAAMTISGLPCTLVPTAYFEKEKASDLLNFANKSPISSIDFTAIPKLKATIVHENDEKLTSVFLEKHPYGKLFLNAGLLIETLLRINRYDNSDKLYIDIRKTGFDLFVLRNGKLIIYNQFESETPNDLLYHVLNTAQQLEVDIQKATVYVSGDIKNNDAQYALLAEYIKNLKLNNGLEDYEYGLQLNNVEVYQYMSLLNLSVCV